MRTDFVEELRWRGMLDDLTPGTADLLRREVVSGYIGFDPTADSLGVGNLAQVMTLLHFQQAGHKPYVLVGGATGMVGDPSGKSDERNLLSEEALQKNLEGQRTQLLGLLDFTAGPNGAELVNNYDWVKDVSFLAFLREVGKHITVNSMMGKDSVKRRLGTGEEGGTGMSFTEFSYQLVQGYDFWWLWKHRGVKLQMGGSDQWGNIVTGTELIRKKSAGEAYALTTTLITKADGSKFGKTEKGNLWLDPRRTSPYEFYQFWLNASDADAGGYLRRFTLLDRPAVEGLEADHAHAPQERVLQRTLAKDITTRVHGAAELKLVLAATEVLFGKGALEELQGLSEEAFQRVFQGAGVPVAEVPREALAAGLPLPELALRSGLVASKGEAHKLIQGNGLSLNKRKVADARATVGLDALLNGRWLLLQKGKKDYCLVKAVG